LKEINVVLKLWNQDVTLCIVASHVWQTARSASAPCLKTAWYVVLASCFSCTRVAGDSASGRILVSKWAASVQQPKGLAKETSKDGTVMEMRMMKRKIPSEKLANWSRMMTHVPTYFQNWLSPRPAQLNHQWIVPSMIRGNCASMMKRAVTQALGRCALGVVQVAIPTVDGVASGSTIHAQFLSVGLQCQIPVVGAEVVPARCEKLFCLKQPNPLTS